MNKRGALQWEYLVAIILVLLVIILGLLFLNVGKEMVIVKSKSFFKDFLQVIGR